MGDPATFRRFVALCSGRPDQMLNTSSLAGIAASRSRLQKPGWASSKPASWPVAPAREYFQTADGDAQAPFPRYRLRLPVAGIRAPEQFRAHPFRGPIFETRAVSEIVKDRANRGVVHSLSFHRDRNGAESDPVVERPDSVMIIDARSSGTASLMAPGASGDTHDPIDRPVFRRRDVRRSGPAAENGPHDPLERSAQVRPGCPGYRRRRQGCGSVHHRSRRSRIVSRQDPEERGCRRDRHSGNRPAFGSVPDDPFVAAEKVAPRPSSGAGRSLNASSPIGGPGRASLLDCMGHDRKEWARSA